MYYSKSSIGYTHSKRGMVCQDFSASYHDETRTIVTTCDGHGGALYVRSDIGSKFASDALMNVFKSLTEKDLRGNVPESTIERIKLNVLCEWNRMVETHIAKNQFRKKELRLLSEDERERLLNNKVRAYGTTMIGAMVLGKKAIVIQLGDGCAVLETKGRIQPAFEESEDEPVANVTYSMCGDDVFKHIHACVFDFRDVDAIVLSTDGVINPYQNFDNFNESFVKPMIRDRLEHKPIEELDEFIERLGNEIGIGDDVSLGVIINDQAKRRYYITK